MLIRVTFKKIKHEGDFWCPNCSPQSSSSFFPRDNHYPEVGMKSLSQLFLYFYTHSHKQHTILFCFKTIHKRLHITYLSTSCFSHSTVYFHPAALFRVFFFFSSSDYTVTYVQGRNQRVNDTQHRHQGKPGCQADFQLLENSGDATSFFCSPLTTWHSAPHPTRHFLTMLSELRWEFCKPQASAWAGSWLARPQH